MSGVPTNPLGFYLDNGGHAMNCPECNRVLLTLGWGYYSHPPLKDHFKRTKATEYQCSEVHKISHLP